MLVLGTLVVIPRSAKYEQDNAFWGKMDPECSVIFDGEEKSTEIAFGQGKTPIWKTVLNFALRADHITKEDTKIQIETFDSDGKKKRQPIGAGYIYLKDITKGSEKQQSIKLYDVKNKFAGVINVDVRISTEQLPVDSIVTKQNVANTVTGIGPGTLIVRPKIANLILEPEKAGKVHPYVVIIMGDQAYQTNVAKVQGKLASWQDALSFDLRDDEVFVVRVLDSEEINADDPLSEALINLQYVIEALVQGTTELTINLEYRGKDAGQLTLEFEYYKEVFENPVKFYPIINIPRGRYVCKKIKYTNPDTQKKTLSIVTNEKSSLLQVRNPALTLNSKSYTEIRLKLFAPEDTSEAEARIDVIVEELNQVEETLIFRIRAV